MADTVEMVVESVRVHMLSNRHVVILKEADRERYLPIWIGPWEASAIAMRLQGQAPERPLTHDLFTSALEALGTRIERVVILDLADETYIAQLVLEREGDRMEVDARPSDAIALAVRTGARVFAATSVLERAGLGLESGIVDGDLGDVPEGGTGSRRPGRPLESIGGGPADERLGVFRDFINSLDPDLGAPGGGSSPGPGAGPAPAD